MADRWRSLAREPLVHFLVAGFLLFLISGRADPVDPASRSIFVDTGQIARISANWKSMWHRPPTDDELDRLIDGFIREEIYYREALRIGLDQDDTVIRRRLRSKMEFLARASVESAAPEDAVLQQWLDDHAALYAPGATMNFDQIYLGENPDIAAVLGELRQGADPAELGVSITLPFAMTDASQSAIDRQFGEAFARAIDLTQVGEWQGPVQSGFGHHLVRVTGYEAGATPQLTEMRQRVENDWRAATLAKREEQAYAILRAVYSVEIENVD